MELISEFFYEAFRRIIPGLVALALYWHNEAGGVHIVRKLIRADKDFSLVVFIVCILVAAWLVGFVFERITTVLSIWLWKLVGRNILKSIRRCTQAGQIKHDETNDEGRRQLYMFRAEKEMSRSLWVIFFLAGIVHFHRESILGIEFYSRSIFYIGMTLAFFFCWIAGMIMDPELNTDEPNSDLGSGPKDAAYSIYLFDALAKNKTWEQAGNSPQPILAKTEWIESVYEPQLEYGSHYDHYLRNPLTAAPSPYDVWKQTEYPKILAQRAKLREQRHKP